MGRWQLDSKTKRSLRCKCNYNYFYHLKNKAYAINKIPTAKESHLLIFVERLSFFVHFLQEFSEVAHAFYALLPTILVHS